MKPRDTSGRFVSPHCDDPHCGGYLVYEPVRINAEYNRAYWRCDGLTYTTMATHLFHCGRELYGPWLRRM